LADRNALGQFVRGHAPSNKGQGGRPPRGVEERIIRALSDEIDNGKLKAMVRAVSAKAQEGDLRAVRLVMEYLVGMPRQRTEITISEEMRELVQDWESGNDSDTDPAESNDPPTSTPPG
jgi:hypothetical protein